MDLLHAYSQNQAIWTDDFNIPESGNGVPDLLDEVKWASTGWCACRGQWSVFPSRAWPRPAPPSAATGASLYGKASTSATLAAAAYAYGAKVYGSHGTAAFNTYAADLTDRAKKAWDWAPGQPQRHLLQQRPSPGHRRAWAPASRRPTTGRAQARLVAAIYPFELTGEACFRDYGTPTTPRAPMFASSWLSPFSSGITRPLLHYARCPAPPPAWPAPSPSATLSCGTATTTPAGAPSGQARPLPRYLTDYTWGSNGVKALAGGMFADLAPTASAPAAADISNAGADYLHYLHGVNPLGKVYLSNMGKFGATNSVDQFYHTWFADGSAKWDSVKTSTYGPAPGFPSAGPTLASTTGTAAAPASRPSARPAPRRPTASPPRRPTRTLNDSWPPQLLVRDRELPTATRRPYIRLPARFVK